nr:hypothetical protein [Fredinandcohnia onubensis]
MNLYMLLYKQFITANIIVVPIILYEVKLYNIRQDLTISNQDISSAVQIASGKKYFLHDGYKYNLYRKIQ